MLKATLTALIALTLIGATPAPPQPVDPYQKAFERSQAQFNSFAQSVYTPYCAAHKGVVGLALIGAADQDGNKPAWPAVVSCKDGHVVIVKSPLEKPI